MVPVGLAFWYTGLIHNDNSSLLACEEATRIDPRMKQKRTGVKHAASPGAASCCSYAIVRVCSRLQWVCLAHLARSLFIVAPGSAVRTPLQSNVAAGGAHLTLAAGTITLSTTAYRRCGGQQGRTGWSRVLARPLDSRPSLSSGKRFHRGHELYDNHICQTGSN